MHTQVLLWSVLGAYVVKYGETWLPFLALNDEVAPYAAGVMIGGLTSLNVAKWAARSRDGAPFEGLI